MHLNGILCNPPDVLRSQSTTNAVTVENFTPPNAKCGCPRQDLPRPLPTALPFPAIEENRQKLQDYLLEYYRSSTLNTCEKQPFPLMRSPPPTIQIDLQSLPVAHHSPIPVAEMENYYYIIIMYLVQKPWDSVALRSHWTLSAPVKNILKAIIDFPIPSNIADLRSWFGLINQATYAFSISNHILPFHELLKSKTPFIRMTNSNCSLKNLNGKS